MNFSSWFSRPGAILSVFQKARLAVRLLREPRVPLLLKTIPVLTLLYVISPVDLVPDLLPVLGQLDDLGIVLLGLELFVRWCPSSIQSFHQDAIARRQRYSPIPPTADVIDAEWRRE